MGVREELWKSCAAILSPAPRAVPVSRVLRGLPKLRSGLTRASDGPEEWRATLQELISSGLLKTRPKACYAEVRRAVLEAITIASNLRADRSGEFIPGQASIGYRPDWFLDSRIGGILNHASRPHMASDLHRYLFASAYAKVVGRSPELRDLPVDLLPRTP